ncbi:MAG: hypothetical protein H6867_06000 [Rhodospirillales bacterium]|nr:hypothetical protein [Rhodospirillales bacterium]MCB9995081.1 hypothetical protein [Rhodospirillales bacterium]
MSKISSQILPKEITSYDLLKTFAVVLMVIDHVGYYFYDDQDWWRVFGRMCVPAWFFLIGYARSRDIGRKMWVGAGMLVAGDILFGVSIFPLNILATMIAIRLVLDGFMERALRTSSTFWAMVTILFFLIVPTGMLVEYGTQGLLMAIVGYFARNREEIRARYKDLTNTYFIFAFFSYIAMQSFLFGFDEVQFYTLAAGCAAVMGALYVFRPMTFPRLTAVLPGVFVWLLQFTGRRTLEIYVAHLLLFKFMGFLIDPGRFAFLDFDLFYFSLEDITESLENGAVVPDDLPAQDVIEQMP